MAKTNGWAGYEWGLMKGDDKKTVADIQQDTDLLKIMRAVEEINKQNMPQSERHKQISELINIPGIEDYAD